MPRGTPSSTEIIGGVMRARDAARKLRMIADAARRQGVDILADRLRVLPFHTYNRITAILLRLARGHAVTVAESRDVLKEMKRRRT